MKIRYQPDDKKPKLGVNKFHGSFFLFFFVKQLFLYKFNTIFFSVVRLYSSSRIVINKFWQRRKKTLKVSCLINKERKKFDSQTRTKKTYFVLYCEIFCIFQYGETRRKKKLISNEVVNYWFICLYIIFIFVIALDLLFMVNQKKNIYISKKAQRRKYLIIKKKFSI